MSSPGVTHVMGDLVLNSGTLEIEIGGTGVGDYDRVQVDGVTMLGGTLSVKLIDLTGGAGPFVPQLGDQFAFLASDLGTGQMFDDFDYPELPPGLAWALTPGDVATFLTIIEAAAGLSGDYNNDGIVDAADYTVWRDHFGEAALPFNETASLGTVDQADYDAWKANFGATTNMGAGSTAVPEPTAWLLAVAALGWCLLKRST